MTAHAIEPVSLRLDEHDPAAFAAALGSSFSRHGFAVVADHGLDQARIEAAMADARAFFALPGAEKRRFAVPGGKGQRGYTPFGVEAAKGADHADLKEFWHVGRELPASHPLGAVMPANLWPETPATFRAHTLWLFGALESLGARLLRSIALHLGLAADAFAGPTACGNSVLRLLHYPSTTGEGTRKRAGAHGD